MIELQDAPMVGVAEGLEPEPDPLDQIPNMEAHVYNGGTEVARCGLPLAQDAHAQMQISRGERYFFKLHDTACGDCGAPVCATCLAEFRKARGVA